MTRRSWSPTVCSTSALLHRRRPGSETTTKADDSVLTWDVSAIQEINPDINVYARVAKGYRAPAIQGRILFDRDVTTRRQREHHVLRGGHQDRAARPQAALQPHRLLLQDQGPAALGGRRRHQCQPAAQCRRSEGPWLRSGTGGAPGYRPDADCRSQLQQDQDPRR